MGTVQVVKPALVFNSTALSILLQHNLARLKIAQHSTAYSCSSSKTLACFCLCADLQNKYVQGLVTVSPTRLQGIYQKNTRAKQDLAGATITGGAEQHRPPVVQWGTAAAIGCISNRGCWRQPEHEGAAAVAPTHLSIPSKQSGQGILFCVDLP